MPKKVWRKSVTKESGMSGGRGGEEEVKRWQVFITGYPGVPLHVSNLRLTVGRLNPLLGTSKPLFVQLIVAVNLPQFSCAFGAAVLLIEA